MISIFQQFPLTNFITQETFEEAQQAANAQDWPDFFLATINSELHKKNCVQLFYAIPEFQPLIKLPFAIALTYADYSASYKAEDSNFAGSAGSASSAGCDPYISYNLLAPYILGITRTRDSSNEDSLKYFCIEQVLASQDISVKKDYAVECTLVVERIIDAKKGICITSTKATVLADLNLLYDLSC